MKFRITSVSSGDYYEDGEEHIGECHHLNPKYYEIIKANGFSITKEIQNSKESRNKCHCTIVDIPTIEELMRFANIVGEEIIITEDTYDTKQDTIEIYDDYRE